MDEGATLVQVKSILTHGYPLLAPGWISWESIPFHYLLAPFLALGMEMHWALRLLPALAGVGAIFLTYRIAKSWTNSTGASLMAAFLMAFLNVQIEWSRQGKAYTVLQCLLLGAVWLAQDRGRSVSVARGLWLALALVLAMATHRAGYLALLVVSLDWGWRVVESAWKRQLRWRSIVLLLALTGVCIGWAMLFRGPSGWEATVAALRQARGINYFGFYAAYLFNQMGWGLALAVVGGIGLLVRHPRTTGPVWVSCLAYSGIISFKSHLFGFRYLLPLMPFLCIYAATPYAWISQAAFWDRFRFGRLTRVFMLGLLMAILGSANLSLLPRREYAVDDTVPRPDWRQAAALIRERIQREEATAQGLQIVASAVPPVMSAYLGDLAIELVYLPINMTGYPGEEHRDSPYLPARAIPTYSELQNVKGYVVLDEFGLQALLDMVTQTALSLRTPDAIVGGKFATYIWILR